MSDLVASYTHGTYRVVPPKQTLATIASHLSTMGITRCADVTGLDDNLGVPTYCAIRPNALVLQTSNGKGLTHTSAKVSALMEAIELYHAENPELGRLQRASLNHLSQKGLSVARPEEFCDTRQQFFSDDYLIEWVEGEQLLHGESVWVPASAVYYHRKPLVCPPSSHGLASGNHLVEATLHALYELIERDAISKVSVNGRLKIQEKCLIIDTKTITDDTLQNLISTMQTAQNKLVLLWVKSCIPVHTFWAILLNQAPFSAAATVNIGSGAHLNIDVAAARAITEAVQSRLTFIHGSREDIASKPVYKKQSYQPSTLYKYFDHLESNTNWQEIAGGLCHNSIDLIQSYDYLRSELAAAGHDHIIRINLTQAQFNIPVVKVLAPSLRFNRRLF